MSWRDGREEGWREGSPRRMGGAWGAGGVAGSRGSGGAASAGPERSPAEGGRFGRVLRTGLTLVLYLAGVTLLLYLVAFVAFLVAS